MPWLKVVSASGRTADARDSAKDAVGDPYGRGITLSGDPLLRGKTKRFTHRLCIHPLYSPDAC